MDRVARRRRRRHRARRTTPISPVDKVAPVMVEIIRVRVDRPERGDGDAGDEVELIVARGHDDGQLIGATRAKRSALVVRDSLLIGRIGVPCGPRRLVADEGYGYGRRARGPRAAP